MARVFESLFEFSPPEIILAVEATPRVGETRGYSFARISCDAADYRSVGRKTSATTFRVPLLSVMLSFRLEMPRTERRVSVVLTLSDLRVGSRAMLGSSFLSFDRLSIDYQFPLFFFRIEEKERTNEIALTVMAGM